MFGDRVANTVESCSDSTATDPTEKPPWRGRKVKYLEHLQSADKDALMVSAADKLHNARAILSDYREIGEQLFVRFERPKRRSTLVLRRVGQDSAPDSGSEGAC